MLNLQNGGSPLSSKNDSLIPLSQLAFDLGIKPKTKKFDINSYIPITLIPANKLFADKEFQRLIIMSFIKGAQKFDGPLARPLFVFLRPSGEYSVADGQHTTILGILYTDQGRNLELPCQVIEHPKDLSDEECIKIEADYFKKLNKNRRNVGKIDQLRANIALKDKKALQVLEDLIDMGIHVENLGDTDGPEVWGFDMLMHAHKKYGLSCVRKAIHLYQKVQKDIRFSWNDIDKPLNGGFIGGLSAVFHLMDGQFIGGADKKYALNDYLENYLGNTAIKTTKGTGFTDNTSGVVQSILIARKIVENCNVLIKNKVITKRDGTFFSIDGIGDDAMANAGLEDPSKMDLKNM
tara:strand:+ start:183 stop:1232 length:1050 start_codon:yes stop_codon:yes gene_type:complete